MDMKTYISTHSSHEIEELAHKAKTKPVYLRQIASGFRKASGPLALRLEEASEFKLSRHALRPDLYPEGRT